MSLCSLLPPTAEDKGRVDRTVQPVGEWAGNRNWLHTLGSN